MSCEITRNKASIVTIAQTIVFGALTTGAIIGAIAASTTLAIVALSVGAAVAGIFTLISLGNALACCLLDSYHFCNAEFNWHSVHILTLILLRTCLSKSCYR